MPVGFPHVYNTIAYIQAFQAEFTEKIKTVLYYGTHIHHLSAIHTAQQCSKRASFCVYFSEEQEVGRQTALCKCEM